MRSLDQGDLGNVGFDISQTVHKIEAYIRQFEKAEVELQLKVIPMIHISFGVIREMVAKGAEALLMSSARLAGRACEVAGHFGGIDAVASGARLLPLSLWSKISL